MKQLTFITVFFFFALSVVAKNNIVVKIGNKSFTKDEYERIYLKNNSQLNNPEDVKTPEEYLELFINYKLKVIEAENQGIDTAKSFIDELAGYRTELAKPYLTDISYTDSMIKQAYFRTVNEIKASHILLSIPKKATPEDTLEIYKKAIDIRNQFINKDKTFEELAKEYSEDPSAKQNGGNIGYFNAFRMVAPFENGAYSTPVGEVSMPVRSRFGYHLIYVTDLRKSKGKIKVAHIMKAFKNWKDVKKEENSKLKAQADSIYQLLLNGADFAEMAKENTDDRGTKNKGGEMGWISSSFRVSEFTDAAFNLKDTGNITIPIRTPYGWHIIKLLDRKPPKTFEELENDLTQKVKNDPDRSRHSKESYIKNKKEQYGFETYTENIELFKTFIEKQNDTIKHIPQNIKELPLYKISDSIFTGNAFFTDLVKKTPHKDKTIKSNFALNFLKEFNEVVVDDYVNNNLETNHPEFAQIMQEYRDGMLLFSIMQTEIWDKAIADTLGLEQYYDQHKGEYLWDKHFDGLLVHCFNQTAVDIYKELTAKGELSIDSIASIINNDKRNIKIKKGKWEEGDNKKIDYLVFNAEKPKNFKKNFDFIEGKVVDAGEPKQLNEARGLYISDYQNQLEQDWIKQLKSKYPIKINKKVLKKVQSL